MTQPNPYQPVFTGVEQVQAALGNFASRQGGAKAFVRMVEGEMRGILGEAGRGPGRPLDEIDVGYVQSLADALNELASNLTAAQQGGPGTDVSPEQEHALMGRVRSAIRRFHMVTRAS